MAFRLQGLTPEALRVFFVKKSIQNYHFCCIHLRKPKIYIWGEFNYRILYLTSLKSCSKNFIKFDRTDWKILAFKVGQKVFFMMFRLPPKLRLSITFSSLVQIEWIKVSRIDQNIIFYKKYSKIYILNFCDFWGMPANLHFLLIVPQLFHPESDWNKNYISFHKALAKLHKFKKSQKNSLKIEIVGTYPDPNCPWRGQMGL